MSGTSVERTTEGVGHVRRPAASQTRHRSRSRCVRRTDGWAGLTQDAVLVERARIARELHDSVSQTLYAIILGASRVRSLLQQNKDSEVHRLILSAATSAQALPCAGKCQYSRPTAAPSHPYRRWLERVAVGGQRNAEH